MMRCVIQTEYRLATARCGKAEPNLEHFGEKTHITIEIQASSAFPSTMDQIAARSNLGEIQLEVPEEVQ